MCTAPPIVRQVRTLASGSSGNATFARLGQTRLLIDVGVSMTALDSALAEIDESVDDLAAVVVTHEHTDHVSGLERLIRRRPELPIFATPGTFRALQLTGCDARRIRPGKKVGTIGGVDIIPFAVSHDAAEPVGVRLEAGDFAMGIATDLGEWSHEVAEALHGCPLVVVEANHDTRMLATGPYPPFLRRRVASRRGHLDNRQTRTLLARIADPVLECVVLAHLSETNNEPGLAHAAAADALDGAPVTIVVADRRTPGPLLEPANDAVFDGPPRQLALF